MKKENYLILLFPILFLIACNSQNKKPEEVKTEEQATESSPKEMLSQAYQLFKEGDDEGSIQLANTVLKIGKETKNDTLIGKALTSLCRNAQRKLDTARLGELSDQLVDLATSSGDQKWLMYRAHMNAEMWRLIGNMNRAEAFYNESMKISFETGSMGMYTIDHFNKSFVSTAKGDFETTKELIKKYYQLRAEANKDPEDAYGLIALAYLLEQQKNYEEAHEIATVTRRLFKEQNLFPEPPDEKPLLLVEAKAKEMLNQETLDEISSNSESQTVSSLLEKYLK
jgi:tetratricopeptide (TPR) repeat protein|tara:strand:+ start:18512 stop:19360 length:849 start_codon:yes stop_codon:yes gene_type:complete